MNDPNGVGGRSAADIDVTAVVPLRDGVSGKSRLAGVLDDDARRALVTVLAQHVVGTLLATPQVNRVVVVTADPAFAREALDELADVGQLTFLAQPAQRPGLNGALDVAREWAAGQRPVGQQLIGRGQEPLGQSAGAGADGSRSEILLIAHADLPALTPRDVTDLLRTAELPQTDVVLATDREGRGTNLLVLELAAHDFRFRFGVDSRAVHEAEGRRLGLRVRTVERPGTAVDLDTVRDWNELPAAVRTAVARWVPFPAGP